MEDSGRDHDAFDVGQNARMLEKTRVGERGDDRLLMVVCQLRNIGFSGKKLVKERIDRGEVDPSGPHDEPQLVDGALLPFVDSIEDPFSISAAAARVKVAATTNSPSRSRWLRTSRVRRKVFPEPAEAVTKRLFTMGGLLVVLSSDRGLV